MEKSNGAVEIFLFIQPEIKQPYKESLTCATSIYPAVPLYLPAASSAVRTRNTAFLFDFSFPGQKFHRRRFCFTNCPLLISHLKTDFPAVYSDLYRINIDFFRLHAALIKNR